jgi:putative spermidine/putrescine transport system permease protein
MKAVAVGTLLTATFAFLLAPIIVVVMSSFNASGILSFPPQAFTTRWYAQIDPGYYHALYVSLVVATITVIIAVLVGVPGALALSRGRFPGRDLLNAICLSPLMVPALVMPRSSSRWSSGITSALRSPVRSPVSSSAI